MIWEYEITNITEQQSMSNELLNGRPKKLILSTYSRLILFLLLAILIIAFPNLTDSLLLLLINIITTGHDPDSASFVRSKAPLAS